MNAEFEYTSRNKKTNERLSVLSIGGRETKKGGTMDGTHSNCTINRNRGSRFNCVS